MSASGGLSKALDRAQEIGAECVQIFCSSPQSWAFKSIPQDETRFFRQKAYQSDIGPNFLHGIYLVNLGTQNPEALEKGVQSLINYMVVAHEIGAKGVIFHGGSHKGLGFEKVLEQTANSMRNVLDNSPDDTLLILENSAGMGAHIGSNFQEIGRILRAVGSPRLKICLDTQHCFAAGYDVTRSEGLETMLEEFDQEVGIERLAAVHANDSKVEFGSGVDRHENIGQGRIGLEGFLAIMGNPAFREIPFLLEVPGIEGKGPDKINVDILKDLRNRISLW